jgi:cyclic pyranopterin phosphate synthase
VTPPAVDARGRGLRDLRVSVTDRCNFRCPYCMPREVFGVGHAFLPRDELLSFEEIARLVAVFAELGVTKVRLTGGEPLLRRDLERLVGLIAATPGITDIAMTTNGSLLATHAAALAEAGLSRVTVSLDSLDPSSSPGWATRRCRCARCCAGSRPRARRGWGR